MLMGGGGGGERRNPHREKHLLKKNELGTEKRGNAYFPITGKSVPGEKNWGKNLRQATRIRIGVDAKLRGRPKA